MLFAASVILLTAVPFGDAVLGSGAMVGISPYLLLQWIVPVATETPELVVAFVLLTHGRGGQSAAVLLAGAVSQYTLALGTLPLAYLAGAGAGPLPLPGRERVELLLSIGVALYAVASLITLRLSRGDTAIMLGLFSAQFLLPAVITRLALALAFLAIAVDVLVHERRSRARAVRCAVPRPKDAGPRGGARTRDRGPKPTRPFAYTVTSCSLGTPSPPALRYTGWTCTSASPTGTTRGVPRTVRLTAALPRSRDSRLTSCSRRLTSGLARMRRVACEGPSVSRSRGRLSATSRGRPASSIEPAR